MAQHVILAAQLVPQYKSIGRCNNYVVLHSIPCSPKCKIVGLILLDYCLSHELTATAHVPAVYLQQLWQTVSKVPDTKDTIKFMLDTQQFIYTMDMFCDTLKLPVETPENPFVAPANIHTIEAIMNRVGYQGVKNESIQYPRFIKLIIVDLMKKFPNIPKRLEEDYHSIKDDVPLVSVYTMGNVLVRGMLIPDALLTAEIRETNDFKEYETVFIKQTVKKDDNDSEDRIDPGSHKDNPEVVDDDDDKEREKQDDEMGSLEIRNEETQTTIPTPLRALRRMCRRQVNTIIKDRDAFHSEVPAFVSQEFKTHAPKIITKLFEDFVQSNVIHVHPTTSLSNPTDSSADLQYQLYLKMNRSLQDQSENFTLGVALRLNKDREVSPVDISGMVSKEFVAHGPKLIEELFRKHMQNTTLNLYPKTMSLTATTSSADLQQQLYLIYSMATFEILDELMEVADSSRLQDRMKVWFLQAPAEEEDFVGFLHDRCVGLRMSISNSQRLIAELEALGECRDVVRCLDHMRQIVGRDSAKLGALEQLLAGAHVGMGLKDGYVADIEEKD
ncbi:hypothetical protein Tco_0917759 [Tanacetum coccineum]